MIGTCCTFFFCQRPLNIICDVGGEFNDTIYITFGRDKRGVGCFEPEVGPIFAHTAEAVAEEFPFRQILPELFLFRGGSVFFGDKYSVVFADDLTVRIACSGKKIIIGSLNNTIAVEFNDRH